MRGGFRFGSAFLFVIILSTHAICSAQISGSGQAYPSRLPYSFSNFVWWSSDELRALLKRRVSGLGDEIAPDSVSERRIRDALKAILKEKGIVADVQSEEPSSFALTAERAPGTPEPGIVFSILSPKILVERVVITQAPDGIEPSLSERLRLREDHEYSGGHDWWVRSNAEEELESKGYLDAKVDVSHDAPRRDGDHYAVNLIVSIQSGRQYRISSITADGGPLLAGKDLSSFFTEKPGDVVSVSPFGQLAGNLRAFYWQYGYADVEIHGPEDLDRAHALAAYHLSVTPGSLYHLRSLTIHNLNPEQENDARKLVGMKPGDVFNGMVVSDLAHKLATDPMLAAYGFTFTPAKDKAAAEVDLTLDFYKVSNKSSVITK